MRSFAVRNRLEQAKAGCKRQKTDEQQKIENSDHSLMLIAQNVPARNANRQLVFRSTRSTLIAAIDFQTIAAKQPGANVTRQNGAGEISMRKLILAAMAVAISGAVHAGTSLPVEGSRIKVLGSASVETPPDIAKLSFTIRGEGSNADAATSALVSKKDIIESGLLKFADAKIDIRTGDLAIDEVRGKGCDGAGGYDERAHLSIGVCAIVGYVASLDVTVRVSPVQTAGTLLGLIGRLGGSAAKMSEFLLSNATDANKRAATVALANGRAQAEAIAIASGGRIGRLISVEDSRARDLTEDIIVTAQRRSAPPAVFAPPIAVNLAPGPIETSAQLTLVFEILQ